MRTAILAALLLSGCAWTPRVYRYPSGLVIMRVDQYTLDSVCPITRADDGHFIVRGSGEHLAGCYDQGTRIVYLLNNCEGAESLPHELAHREGIADPERAGFNW